MPPLNCHRAPIRPLVTAHPADPAWQHAVESDRFVDMVTGNPGWFDTRVRLLWDDDNLYARFWSEEPFIEAHLTERDALIFNESDIELFVDGGDSYYEFEMNARGTVYEVFFVWQDAFARGGQWSAPEWDVRNRRAVTFGGNEDRTAEHFWRGTHPRGLRWAYLDWDWPGLRTAVHIDGTLNENSDVDRGWIADLALPWAGFAALANGRRIPPADGDVWRMFLARFERMTAGGKEIQPHPAWCLSPHGIYDTHMPEKWSEVRFVSTPRLR